MDCADEAALIRHALNLPGIDELSFDLVGRRVDVSYQEGAITPVAILEAVAGTGLVAHTHSSTELVRDDHDHHDHHHDTARWWAVASGVALGIGWLIDGWQSDTWTEALFGARSEFGDQAHHGYAVAAYAVSAAAGLWPMLPRAWAKS